MTDLIMWHLRLLPVIKDIYVYNYSKFYKYADKAVSITHPRMEFLGHNSGYYIVLLLVIISFYASFATDVTIYWIYISVIPTSWLEDLLI